MRLLRRRCKPCGGNGGAPHILPNFHVHIAQIGG